MRLSNGVSRRGFLKQTFAAAAATFVPQGSSSIDHGAIKPPRALPGITVHRQDGRSATLEAIARGRVTAVQLMFTKCTTTCPMQGAIFERVQSLLMPEMAARGIQLVSLSIDPVRDTPEALTEWLSMFHAGQSWIGAAPAVHDVETLKTYFGVGNTSFDPHSTQTNLLDREGRLIFRTGELPPPEQVASLLRHFSAPQVG